MSMTSMPGNQSGGMGGKSMGGPNTSAPGGGGNDYNGNPNYGGMPTQYSGAAPGGMSPGLGNMYGGAPGAGAGFGFNPGTGDAFGVQGNQPAQQQPGLPTNGMGGGKGITGLIPQVINGGGNMMKGMFPGLENQLPPGTFNKIGGTLPVLGGQPQGPQIGMPGGPQFNAPPQNTFDPNTATNEDFVNYMKGPGSGYVGTGEGPGSPMARSEDAMNNWLTRQLGGDPTKGTSGDYEAWKAAHPGQDVFSLNQQFQSMDPREQYKWLQQSYTGSPTPSQPNPGQLVGGPAGRPIIGLPVENPPITGFGPGVGYGYNPPPEDDIYGVLTPEMALKDQNYTPTIAQPTNRFAPPNAPGVRTARPARATQPLPAPARTPAATVSRANVQSPARVAPKPITRTRAKR